MLKFVGWYIEKGWTEPMKMYNFYCDICKKLVVNYVSGGKKVVCPICINKLVSET